MSAAGILDDAAGVWIHRGPAPRMTSAHRHDDLELNLVTAGRLDYLFGGRPLRVPEGRLALFWAATPHRLIEAETPAQVSWLHLPLDTALGWRLPDDGLGRLLQDRPIVVDAAPFGDLAATFARWSDDLRTRGGQEIALLEAQALVRRVLRADREEAAVARPSGAVSEAVAAMAALLTTRFREPLRIADVAAAVHLHPSTAMAAFRSALGVTLAGYLTRCRVAEGQRLLITTDDPVAAIAVASGFGSQSAFYDAFRRLTGVAPAAYRRRRRDGAQGRTGSSGTGS